MNRVQYKQVSRGLMALLFTIFEYSRNVSLTSFTIVIHNAIHKMDLFHVCRSQFSFETFYITFGPHVLILCVCREISSKLPPLCHSQTYRKYIVWGSKSHEISFSCPFRYTSKTIQGQLCLKSSILSTM